MELLCIVCLEGRLGWITRATRLLGLCKRSTGRGSIGKTNDCFVTKQQVLYTIHGPVGLFFFRQAILCGNLIFRNTRHPWQRPLVLCRLFHCNGPIHGSEIKPVVRPAQELLRIGIDELGEKNSVKRWVLANKDCFFSSDIPLSKKIDNGLRNMPWRLAF